MKCKLGHAGVIAGSGCKLRDIKPKEMAFKCPECGIIYYVANGHQLACQRCSHFGHFNVVGYNWLRPWENNSNECTCRN